MIQSSFESLKYFKFKSGAAEIQPRVPLKTAECSFSEAASVGSCQSDTNFSRSTCFRRAGESMWPDSDFFSSAAETSPAWIRFVLKRSWTLRFGYFTLLSAGIISSWVTWQTAIRFDSLLITLSLFFSFLFVSLLIFLYGCAAAAPSRFRSVTLRAARRAVQPGRRQLRADAERSAPRSAPPGSAAAPTQLPQQRHPTLFPSCFACFIIFFSSFSLWLKLVFKRNLSL